MKKKQLSNIISIMIIVAVIFFIVGLSVGNAQKTKTITVTKDVPVVKTITNDIPTTKTITVTKPADTTDWKALKSVDDSGFTTTTQYITLSGQVDNVCGKAVTDGANQDTAALADDTSKVTNLGKQMNSLSNNFASEVSQRQTILKKLGY